MAGNICETMIFEIYNFLGNLLLLELLLVFIMSKMLCLKWNNFQDHVEAKMLNIFRQVVTSSKVYRFWSKIKLIDHLVYVDVDADAGYDDVRFPNCHERQVGWGT